MNRVLLFSVISLLMAADALAATTWSTDTSQTGDMIRVSKAVCSTGTESVPADGVGVPAVGLDLLGIKGGVVVVEAAGAMTAGGKLLAYVYNPISTKWIPIPDMDIVVPAAQYHAVAFTVWGDWGRLAFVPSGIGQSSTIYVSGRRLPLSLRGP